MPHIQSLYAGKLRPLEPEGQETGIYKQSLESAEVNHEGILGDQQADRRYHGGPEKALHQYSLDAYLSMQQAYPQLEPLAIPGSMGENISSAYLNDRNVCIGDVYRMGAVLLQVSQPRTPCWKINHRFELEKLSLFIEQQRITGWYYRVLEPGNVLTVEPGLYFIDTLLEKWRANGQADTVDWERVEALRPYGGIRIEDNVVVTESGCDNLTRPAFAAL